jgi:hypothetical protein
VLSTKFNQPCAFALHFLKVMVETASAVHGTRADGKIAQQRIRNYTIDEARLRPR